MVEAGPEGPAAETSSLSLSVDKCHCLQAMCHAGPGAPGFSKEWEMGEHVNRAQVLTTIRTQTFILN